MISVLSDYLLSDFVLPSQIKSALMLQIFGGVESSHNLKKTRASIHILLLGEPGRGKSAILNVIANYFHGIQANGVTSSSAGLTAAAIKDSIVEGRWTVEVGAFVFADKGLLALDEVDKIQKKDIAAIHEAMEQ